MIEIRSYCDSDAEAINEIAVQAFYEYRELYEDWEGFAKRLSTFDSLSSTASIIVASRNNRVVAAVGYVPASVDKPSHFPANTPIIRMLVVHPNARGLGLGKRLTLECIAMAQKEGSTSIALHTSSIMNIALPMYERLGFSWCNDSPPINGVEYSVYVKADL